MASALRLDGGEHRARAGFAVLLEDADELVQRLPDGEPRVGARVPVGGVVGPLAAAGRCRRRTTRTPASPHAVDAGALGAGQRVGLAEAALVPAVLLEPVQAELRVGVEVVLGEEAVDELQRGLHGHRRAVGLEHGGVLREDRHAWADDGLRQVHRSDWRTVVACALRHLVECLGQHGVQFADELAPRNAGRRIRSWAADKDDAGCQVRWCRIREFGLPALFALAKCR